MHFKPCSVIVLGLSLSLLVSCQHMYLGVDDVAYHKRTDERNNLTGRISKEALDVSTAKHRQTLEELLEEVLRKHYFPGGLAPLSLVWIMDSKVPGASAAPDDSLTVTSGLLEVGSDFGRAEWAALVCHEAAHIGLGHWSDKIVEEKRSLHFSTKYQTKDSAQNLEDGILGALASITRNEKRRKAFTDRPSHELTSTTEWRSARRTEIQIPLVGEQGFPIQVELEADAEAVRCLDTLQIDRSALAEILRIVRTMPNVDREVVDQRVKALQPRGESR